MRLYSLFVLLFSTLFSTTGYAEQMKTLGSWDVHYITVGTTFLTPEVAKAYGITRSKNSAFVNISVLDKRNKKAQSVSVMGTARNLLGTQKTLNFKEIVDGDAIYYLAVLSFDDKERYRFNIQIVEGNTSQTLKFEQTLYRE